MVARHDVGKSITLSIHSLMDSNRLVVTDINTDSNFVNILNLGGLSIASLMSQYPNMYAKREKISPTRERDASNKITQTPCSVLCTADS